MSEQMFEKKNSKEIYGLDILRFFAATFVMFFHLALGSWSDPRAVSPENDIFIQSFAAISPVVSVGWVGVQIFFVISGFVITFSASGVSAIDFARKRFLRLFPGVALCSLISAAFLLADNFTFSNVILRLINSILFSPIGPWVANSFWTLSVEIVFYTVIFFLILANLISRVELFSKLLLAISIVFWAGQFALPHVMARPPALFMMNNLTQRILLQYGCFFSLGIIFWLGTQFRWTIQRLLVMTFALLTCISAIVGEVDHAGLWFGVPQSKPLAVVIFFVAMMLFYISIRWNAGIGTALGGWSPYVKLAGRATYPLYLLHQPIGETTMHFLVLWGAAPFVALAIAIALSLILAFTIAHMIEPRVRTLIGHLIDKIISKGNHKWLAQVRQPIDG